MTETKHKLGKSKKDFLGVTTLDRIIWEDLTKEVTFEQRPEEDKGACHEDILEESRSGTRESKCKGPEV